MERLFERLYQGERFSEEEFFRILELYSEENAAVLASLAQKRQQESFQNRIYIRGLIEFTNYCRNGCYYCGLQAGNCSLIRYRLEEETILSCCRMGYELGFRTFVLQGGEDPYYTDERVIRLIQKIKEAFPDCALTLSIGEKERVSYEAYYRAGADRYLLRHETASEEHYRVLHPKNLSFQHRMECLRNLKEIGFQTGCGFMVGSPCQTLQSLSKDLFFIQEFDPEMVGIGPFLPQHDTVFRDQKGGSVELTLYLISILRLMNPDLLLPATTALGTAAEDGRSRGILAGANVIMPNLSPVDVRKNYALYDHKLIAGAETAEHLEQLKEQMKAIGYEIVCDRGDYKKGSGIQIKNRS